MVPAGDATGGGSAIIGGGFGAPFLHLSVAAASTTYIRPTMKTAIYAVTALLTLAALVLGYRALTDEEMTGPNGSPPAAVDSAMDDAASVDSVRSAPSSPTDASRPMETPIDVRRHIQEHADLIRLASPTPYQVVESPLEVSGRARGVWFFEASFPLVLVDWDGRIIAEGYASAEGEWMTEEFVPFRGTIEFERPEYGERGTLILQKHNASDRPELDDALEVPVRFEVD